MVCAAAVVCAVALLTAGTHTTASKADHGKPAATKTGLGKPATTNTGLGKPAAAGKAVLQIRYAPGFYYLPRYSGVEAAPEAPEYTVDLKASAATPGGGQGWVTKIEASFDISVFDGVAQIVGVNKSAGCVRSGSHVNCALQDVRLGEGDRVTPFYVKPLPDRVLGPAGTLVATVRSANAPTVRHTTRVIVGSPYLTARQFTKRATGVQPGGEVRLTPAFGNKGDTGVEGGITLLLSTQEATLPLRYSNCRYDKATGATRAECDFPGPLPAGAAFETDQPVVAVADRTARSGGVQYSVRRTADLEYFAKLPASAPHGTGGPLGLRPTDGSGFTGDVVSRSVAADGGLGFDSTQKYDVQAVPFTIKGRVGQVLDVTVPYPLGYGWGGKNTYDKMLVTLPQGISLVGVDPGSHASEILYCVPGRDKGDPVVCPGPETGGTMMRVRIDRRVDGARGSVRVPSDPSTDPDQDDNTAPVTVQYLP